ncbi:MAG: NAD+ synthase [bacterium]
MKITVAQLNPTIGDFAGNLSKIEKTLKAIQNESPDLIIFSELYLSGYPPQDLLEREDFIQNYQKAQNTLMNLSKKFPDTAILCGTIQSTDKQTGNRLYNSAALIQNGAHLFQQHKSLLPTYDVFDEARYFEPAEKIEPFSFKGERLGITICEDAWNNPQHFPDRVYPINPLDILHKKGATVFINLSAVPFGIGKDVVRYRLFQNHAKTFKIPFIHVNQAGGNDDLISGGQSMIFDGKGNLVSIFPPFEEHVQTVHLGHLPKPKPFAPLDETASVHDALVLGIRDYMRKTGFRTAVIGLSGGVDSAVVCCLACKAIGTKNVMTISMPSPYSSHSSVQDARRLAKNLGMSFRILPITPIYQAYLESLREDFAGTTEDITEENIQARIRGNILMAFANKKKSLVLGTGNKSELAVGYCTLYGDMVGGLGVLADVTKTRIYNLAEYINRNEEIIPKRIIQKPPSAELKLDQKDQDDLPPYSVLDQILHLYIERRYSSNQIVEQGFDRHTVDWVINAVAKSEFKRRQAAPGLKITAKAFGIGRRMPIAGKIENPMQNTGFEE